MPPQFVIDPRARTDKHDAEIDFARRRQRAVNDMPRGIVAAHRVNGYPDHVNRVQSSGFRVQGSFRIRGSGFGVPHAAPEP